jgi:hypothetical protein
MRKVLITTGVIPLILVLTSLQSLAVENEICVCVKKNGQMLLRESGQCKPQQSLVCWDVEGPQGPPGECECPFTIEEFNELEDRIDQLEAEPPVSVTVYDAQDQLVGTLVDLPLGWYPRYSATQVGVFLPGINKFALIGGTASPDMTTELLHFQGYGCTGQAYWPESNYYVLRLRNGSTYYSGGDLLVNIGADWPEWSTLDGDGTCTNHGCCLNSPLYEPVEIPVTDLPYVPPLTGPLSFK